MYKELCSLLICNFRSISWEKSNQHLQLLKKILYLIFPDTKLYLTFLHDDSYNVFKNIHIQSRSLIISIHLHAYLHIFKKFLYNKNVN